MRYATLNCLDQTDLFQSCPVYVSERREGLRWREISTRTGLAAGCWRVGQLLAEYFMGVDLLDFTFRIERRFGIKISRDDVRMLEPLWTNRKPFDMTAGEFHDWVLKLCEARGVKIPYSSWTRIRLELAKVVGKPPQIIHRDTLVRRDLGFS